jgi:hypothetical protein
MPAPIAPDAAAPLMPCLVFPPREDPLAFGKPSGWNIEVKLLAPAQVTRGHAIGELIWYDAAQFLTGGVPSWMEPTGRTQGDFPPASFQEWHPDGWIEGWLYGKNLGLPDPKANSRCYLRGGRWARFDELCWQPLPIPQLLVDVIQRRCIPSQAHLRSAPMLSAALSYLHRDYDALLATTPADPAWLDHLNWCARTVSDAHRQLLELDVRRSNITPGESVVGWDALAHDAQAMALACLAGNPAAARSLPSCPLSVDGYGALRTHVVTLKAAIAESFAEATAQHDAHRSRSEVAGAQSHLEDPRRLQVHELEPAVREAWQLYGFAQDQNPELKRDKDVYAWLKARVHLPHPLPKARETWQRRVSEARRLLGQSKHTRRSSRGPSGSIARHGEL